MLKLLVDFLSGIIKVLAAGCIIGGAIAGYLQAPRLDVDPWAGALIGFAVGFLVASVGGGLIACFILIENHLRVLADDQLRIGRHQPVEAEEKQPEETPIERAERVADYMRQYRTQPAAPLNSTPPATDTADSGTTTQAKENSGKTKAT